MILEEIIERLGRALNRPAIGAGKLAKALGVSPQTVRNWRDGDHFPNKNRWERIERVTEVPLEWIFQGDMRIRARDGTEEKLLHLYRGMGDEGRENLLTIAETFFNKAHPSANSRAANDDNPPTLPPVKKLPLLKVRRRPS